MNIGKINRPVSLGLTIAVLLFTMFVGVLLGFGISKYKQKSKDVYPIVNPDWVQTSILTPSGDTDNLFMATIQLDKCYIYLFATNDQIIAGHPMDDCIPVTMIEQFKSPPIKKTE